MFLYILLLAIVAIIVLKLLQRKQLINSLPPGPPALPIIGNLRQLDSEDPRKTYIQWHKQYGPIFTVWFGMSPNIFVTSFELMQELFVKRGDEFADRPQSFLFSAFTRGRYGIVNIDGEMWREQRRFSLHVLRNFGFGRKLMEEKIAIERDILLEGIERRLQGSTSAKMNVKSMLDVCVSNIITSTLMSKTFTEDDPLFAKLKSAMDFIFNFFGTLQGQLLESFPFLHYVPLFNHFGLDDYTAKVDLFVETIQKEIEKCKRELNKQEEPNDYASAYLKEMERRKSTGEDLGYFSEWQLIAIFLDLWSAGMESVITTLYWSMLLMMHHPEVQKKAQKEIDEVVGSERCSEMSDKTSMPYNIAVLHEVQRFGNIVVNNVQHTSKEDTTVLGYKIPKGVVVFPQLSVLHFDDTIFPDSFEFRPERFLDADGKLNKLSEKMLPFSLGKRICLGEGLARTELFLISTAWLQKFSFSFAEDESKPTLQAQIGFTAYAKPFNVRVTRRQH